MTTAERAGPSFELPFSQKGNGTAFRSSEKEPERRSGSTGALRVPLINMSVLDKITGVIIL